MANPETNTTSDFATLDRRLLEAFDSLWGDYVDPRDAYTDANDELWSPVGALGARRNAVAMTVPQLSELRDD